MSNSDRLCIALLGVLMVFLAVQSIILIGMYIHTTSGWYVLMIPSVASIIIGELTFFFSLSSITD